MGDPARRLATDPRRVVGQRVCRPSRSRRTGGASPGRIRRTLAEDGVADFGWNQLAVAAARRDQERPAAALVDEFVAERDAGIALVDGLRDADLGRSAIHAGSVASRSRTSSGNGSSTIGTTSGSCSRTTQSRAWVGMGNTRRFSHPDRP